MQEIYVRRLPDTSAHITEDHESIKTLSQLYYTLHDCMTVQKQKKKQAGSDMIDCDS